MTQANIEPDDVEAVVARTEHRPMGLTGEPEPTTDAVARRRIVNVTAGAFVNGLAIAGTAAVLPLYAVGELGMTKAEYAGLLSLRMTGVTVGVILLGAVGDRFGTKAVTLFALLVGGVLHATIGFVPRAGFVAMLPLIGGLASTTFVNFNYLTQLVGEKHQGWSNTLYRAAGMAAGVVAPWLATRFVDHPGALFLAIGAAMAASAIFVALYPLREKAEPFRGWGEEFRGMASMYASALRERRLIILLTLTCVWMALTASGMTFAALRLTQELHASDAFYGNACSIASAVTLVLILSLGPLLGRRGVKTLTLAIFVVCSLSVLGLGLTGDAMLTASLFVLYSAAYTASVGPMSIWITRAAGRVSLTAALSTHKVLTGLIFALGAKGMEWLEPHLGLTGLFLWTGALSLPTIAAMALLPERSAAHAESPSAELTPSRRP